VALGEKVEGGVKLSVILPSIRPHRLRAWFSSFERSYSGEWELIVVSPYAPPADIRRFTGLGWIQDWGHPVRCQQLGLLSCIGDLIHRGVDDSLYLPGAMDRAIEKMTGGYKTIVAPKYTETNASVDRKHKDFQDMNDPKFYTIAYHNQAGAAHVPPHFKLLNFGIISRALMVEVGGWDCQFESVAIAELDLAVRLQRAGGEIVLSDEIVLECDWMPGHQGDHGPMHDAFAPDMAKYSEIYSKPESEQRVAVELSNWKQAPHRWERRFGKWPLE